MKCYVNRSLWLVARLVAVAPPILLVIFGLMVIRREFSRSNPELLRLLTNQISEALDLKVEIWGLDTSLPGRLSASHVRISKKGFGTLIDTGPVVARYSITALMSNVSEPLTAITSVNIRRPIVYLERRRDGTINFAEAFAPEKAQRGKPFAGLISVSDAKVIYVDRNLPKGKTGPMRIAAYGVNTIGDFRSGQGGTATGTARSTNATGKVSFRVAFDHNARLAVNLSVNDASLASFSSWLYPAASIHVFGGKATGNIIITNNPSTQQSPHYWITAMVKDGSMRLGPGMPLITNVAGQLRLANTNALILDITGRSLGSTWHASGALARLNSPVMALDVSSHSANWRQVVNLARGVLPNTVNAAGSGPLEVSIQGPWKSPVVSGSAVVPVVAWRGYKASDIRTVFSVFNGQMKINASAKTGGGKVAAFGSVRLGKQVNASVRFRFNGVQLASLRKGFGGKASGEAEFDYTRGRPAGKLRFTAQKPGAFGRLASSARGEVALEGEDFVVKSLLIATPGGFVIASGVIKNREVLDMDAAAVGLTGQDIMGPHSPVQAASIDADGRVTGDINNPVFKGSAQVSNIVWGDENLDAAWGDIEISKGQFNTTGLTLVRNTGEALVKGGIERPFSNAPRLNLDVHLQSLELASLGRYIPAFESAGGLASGDLTHIQGRVNEISLDFNLRVEEARYQLYSVPYVLLKGRHDKGKTDISELTAAKGTASLTADGSIGQDGHLDISFSLASFPMLEAVTLALGHSSPVSGLLDVSGSLKGTYDKPILSAQIFVHNLSIAGEHVDTADGLVSWEERKLELSGISLPLSGGKISIPSLSVSTDVDNPGLDFAQIKLEGLKNNPGPDAGRLLSTARSLGLMIQITDPQIRDMLLTSPEHIRGSLSGSVIFSRAKDTLKTSANVTVDGLEVWGAKLGKLTLSAEISGESLNLQQFLLEDDQMRVVASGMLENGGQLSADIEGNNIDLARLPMIKALSGATGKADFSLQAAGTREHPLVEGSLLVSGATIAGIKIERITTGKVTFNDESADFTDATFTSGPHKLRFAGTVPFSVKNRGFVNGGKIDVSGELVNQDLNILSMVSERIDTARTQGPVRAEVKATGQWPHPQVVGLVSVDNGQVALKGMQTLFKNVLVDLALEGDTVAIKKFSLASADGGKLDVQGGASLGPVGWEVSATAKADKLGLKFKNVTQQFQESFAGTIDVDLKASGPLARPLIAGGITVINGVIGLPTIPENLPERSRYVWVPQFDLRLEAGQGAKLRSSALNVGIRGGVTVSKNLNDPLVSGSLRVIDGYVIVPGSRFRVIPEGKVDFRYEPPQPTRVVVDIHAKANLSLSLAGSPAGMPNYSVEMALRGPLSDPNVTFQSNPPGLASSSILALLGQQAGVGPTGFSQGKSFETELAKMLTTNIAPGILAPFEQTLADSLGFQEVAFGYNDFEPLNVQVSRKLAKKISASLKMSLTAGQEEKEWTLNYDITNRIRVSYGRSRFGVPFVGLGGAINF